MPPPLLGQVLWIEASRMAHPLEGVDEDALRRELAVVKNELRARASGHTYGLARLLLAEALFGTTHPYGRVVNQTRSEIDRVWLSDVQAFADQHYQPANATLVVSGRFDPAEAKQLVTKSFGRVRSRSSRPREVLPAPRLAQNVVARFGAPVRARELAVGWLAPPPRKDGYDEIVLAVRAMRSVMLDRLVTDLHLADDVQVDLHPGHLGSMLVVAARLRPDADADRATTEIDRMASRVSTLGRTFEWDRFGQVRLELATSVIMTLESPRARAFGLQDDLEYVGRVQSTAADVARFQALQAANVGGATQQFIVDTHHAVVLLEPDPTAPPGGAPR